MLEFIRRRRLILVGVLAAALIGVPAMLLAADRFTDVPDDNVFHDDITWLADADVTRGCNPPDNTEFCPTETVTRQQMAAFMRRLASNRVVDAGHLQGLEPDQLQSLLAHDSDTADASFPNVAGGFDVIQVQSVTVETPAEGAVLVQAGGNILGNGTTVDNDRQFACWISDDPDSTSSDLGALTTFVDGEAIGGTVISRSFSTTTAFAVEGGGSLDVFLLCRDIQGGAGNDFRVTNGHLSATFIPGDNVVSGYTP